MQSMHPTHNHWTDEQVKRTLVSALETLDPSKVYFLRQDISQWLDPSSHSLDQVMNEFTQGDYRVFYAMRQAMILAIERRQKEDKETDYSQLPKKVKYKELKDLDWANSEGELIERRKKLRAYQMEALSKLDPEEHGLALLRLQKRQKKMEDDVLNNDPAHVKKYVLTLALKATASAMDTHTQYFTPDEAKQFMIGVQQKLVGIGAQLRDDLNGFTIVRMVEGGPAILSKAVKNKDKIIAVNGESVVGMDIEDVVQQVRGKAGTPVRLTLLREGDDSKNPERLEVTLVRDEVQLKESRYSAEAVPFGDGVIGHIRVYNFYQDADSSCSEDVRREIQKMRENHDLKGVILDLRSNTGGLLTQAVNLAGLFIKQGVIAVVKDDDGKIQRLRDTDARIIWTGPLVILVDRASASASEIVAQSLQDYGRALIVGDPETYGKGTFQSFTLGSQNSRGVHDKGEFKVTRGVYYTVSGKSPQLSGVFADVVIPGPFSEGEFGEKYQKNPLANDTIEPSFDDPLDDVGTPEKMALEVLYKHDVEKKEERYLPYLEQLKKNTALRLETNKPYKKFIEKIRADEAGEEEIEIQESSAEEGGRDFQLEETIELMKDLLYLQKSA